MLKSNQESNSEGEGELAAQCHNQRHFSHICDGTQMRRRTEEKSDPRSGSKRHRHPSGLPNSPVQAPTRDHPFHTVIPRIQSPFTTRWGHREYSLDPTPGPSHLMKNQVSALRNLDGILLKLKVYVKFPQGFRCVNIKFPQSVNISPLSFGMVSASGIIELTRLKLA